MTRVAAAVVQAAPVAFDVEATIAKVERLIADAAAGAAGLVVFPEAFISCYPRGITFGATVGARSAEGRVVSAVLGIVGRRPRTGDRPTRGDHE